MKWLLCLSLLCLNSCKPAAREEKQYITPEEQKVIDEIEKTYKK